MKPKLLLHICCAPDEAWVLHMLKEDYDIHCFFCNPNISPLSEYEARRTEAAKVAKMYKTPFTSDNYRPEVWEQSVASFADTPEGGKRCSICFRIRLSISARECVSLGISEFSTVMSVSPHKRIAQLNKEGLAVATTFGVTYRCFDFKKKDGFKKSVALSHRLGLYRQDYCGCRLSREERDIRLMRKNDLL